MLFGIFNLDFLAKNPKKISPQLGGLILLYVVKLTNFRRGHR
nr:MAG TPA: hypothetical protein [Caudoviricetes sp.]